jgi:hypothetical protein
VSAAGGQIRSNCAKSEVKNIRDVALAMACYARQTRNKSLLADAEEIRHRPECGLGVMMVEQRETIGLATGSQGIGTTAGYLKTRTEQPPTLAEAGIDKNMAHRAFVRRAAGCWRGGIVRRRNG